MTHDCRRQDILLDVSDDIDSGERLTQTGWVFAPESPANIKAAIVCLAGGTYDKTYWHLEVAGYPGYSFAEHLVSRGYVVIALDHLGVGGSTDPERSGPVDLDLLAHGDASAAGQVREQLTLGTLMESLEPLPGIPLIGVGHSMGACLTTMVQAIARPYAALVLLGYGVDITNVHEQPATDQELDARVDETESIFRAATQTPAGAVFTIAPRELLHALFHAPNVPTDVILADDRAQSRVPVRAASQVTTAGFVRRYAEVIDVPILLGLGDSDVAPDPRAEPRNYPSSRDISLMVIDGSAHCHNFSSARAALWDRIAAWIPTVVGNSDPE
jgi:alpha-beta hydrolase superfamily lysophospholipase